MALAFSFGITKLKGIFEAMGLSSRSKSIMNTISVMFNYTPGYFGCFFDCWGFSPSEKQFLVLRGRSTCRTAQRNQSSLFLQHDSLDTIYQIALKITRVRIEASYYWSDKLILHCRSKQYCWVTARILILILPQNKRCPRRHDSMVKWR